MTTTFDLLGGIKASPAVRPMFNVGCLLDIPTGRFLLGKHGESILNGGIANVNAICGRGNSFKTALLLYMLLQAMDRYMPSAANVYDTELTLSYQRFADLSKRMMNRLASFDFELSKTSKLQESSFNLLPEREGTISGFVLLIFVIALSVVFLLEFFFQIYSFPPR